MRIRFTCRNSECRALAEISVDDASGAIACRHCGSAYGLGKIAPDVNIERCLICDGDELYVRKDFPQQLGLIMVIIVAVISFYLFYRGELLWSLGILILTVVIDLVIYAVVPKMTVCYRCKAEYRHYRINPEHQGFDLATAEKYR